MYIYIYIYTHTYIYIYIERERKRDIIHIYIIYTHMREHVAPMSRRSAPQGCTARGALEHRNGLLLELEVLLVIKRK